MARTAKTKAPRQAQKEARAAQKEYEAQYGKQGEATPEPAAATVPAEPAAEPPKAPVIEITPPPETPPAAEPVDKPVDWEHKFRTLDGKYTAEVPRLQAQNRDLQQQMSIMDVKIQEQAKAPPPEPVVEGSLLSDEEVADYGEDMISVVRRAARDEIMPEFAKMREENENLRNELGKVESNIAVSAQDKMFNALKAAVPNWTELNRNPTFLDWLTQAEVYSGIQRQDLLTKAFEANDSQRVITFFKGFLAEQTPPNPEAPAAQPVDPAPAGSKLDTLVAPSRPVGPTDSGGAQQSDLIWSNASINAFYADKQRGKFKGREKELAALERDIFTAMKEGRVVG